MNTNVEQTFVNIAKILHSGKSSGNSSDEPKAKRSKVGQTQLKKQEEPCAEIEQE